MTLGLSPHAYRDSKMLDAEIETLFQREWLCIGRETDFAEPGSYVTCRIAAQPVVVWRGSDGQLRAFENVCRHRMSIIASDCGVADQLQCPFHGWTYGWDGSLKGAPGGRDIVASGEVLLPQFSIETWMGFVFVNLDPQAQPLAPRLTPVTDMIAPYAPEEFKTSFRDDGGRVGANWKLMMEIGLESYHFPFVHESTLAANLRGAPNPPSGTGAWTVSVEPRTKTLAAQPDDPAALSEAHRATTYTFGIFPATVFNIDVDNIVWFSVFPDRADLTSSCFGGASRHAGSMRILGDNKPSSVDEYLTWAAQLGAEDNLACERVQQALQGKFVKAGPLLPEKENGVIEFHAYLRERLNLK